MLVGGAARGLRCWLFAGGGVGLPGTRWWRLPPLQDLCHSNDQPPDPIWSQPPPPLLLFYN